MSEILDATRACLEDYRRAVVGLLAGTPGARDAVERAREALASPPLIEALLTHAERSAADLAAARAVIAQACSCGSSPLPCAMHGGVNPTCQSYHPASMSPPAEPVPNRGFSTPQPRSLLWR